MRSGKSAELQILAFKTAKAYGAWLKKNHVTSLGIWLQFYKKGSGVETITYAEALDEALCYGWIDSQVKRFDEKSYLQRFGPRKTKSMWSKINRTHIERLTKDGRMTPTGLAHVTAAKADGRWEVAYDSPKNMAVPDDLLEALLKDKKAEQFFKSLNKANVYAIAWRLQTAKKPETRKKRMDLILAMLKSEQKFH
jgi:uncharacterized protein YdeI (YjbR/CyaY-like superfamily)